MDSDIAARDDAAFGVSIGGMIRTGAMHGLDVYTHLAQDWLTLDDLLEG